MLYLNNDDVTGSGLKVLAALTNLDTLSLVGTKVTDAGLEGRKRKGSGVELGEYQSRTRVLLPTRLLRSICIN
jgi:hypothetical protein